MSVIKSDAQSEKSLEFEALDFVGMSQIETFIFVESGIEGASVPLCVPANLRLGVNLTQGHRGIHMSRLFQLHMDHVLNQKLTGSLILNFLKKCIQSQDGLSDKAYADFEFQLPVSTKALKSDLPGVRSYPICLQSVLRGDQLKIEIQFQILYSSTCPQSVKLSKEFLNQKYNSETIQPWLKQGVHFPATPHAQRSLMTVQIQSSKFSQAIEHTILKFINLVEGTLKTPVQTAVKKSDEMEFARLNGENPMFCEDAIRQITRVLIAEKDIEGFRIRTEHQESLHPHNAAAEISSNYVSMK